MIKTYQGNKHLECGIVEGQHDEVRKTLEEPDMEECS